MHETDWGNFSILSFLYLFFYLLYFFLVGATVNKGCLLFLNVLCHYCKLTNLTLEAQRKVYKLCIGDIYPSLSALKEVFSD